MAHADVQTTLSAKDQGLQSALAKGETSIGKFGVSVGKIVKKAAMAFVALGVAALGAASYLMKLYAEQEKQERKLAAVLKATGNAAGYSADQLKQMAADLQKVTTYGDETTLSAMAVLATFKEIRGDQFKEATKAAMDMSAVLGTDLQGSILQIGKALNDPIKGMTALSRAGVSFTQQQKDQVKSLQEAGDIMGAQKIILAELKGEFGGAAAEMADTFGGRVTQLKNRLGDLGEQIGEALLPAFDSFVGTLGNATAWIEAQMPVIREWIGILMEVGKTLSGYVATAVKFVMEVWAIEFAIGKTVIENFGDSVKLVMTAVAHAVVKSFNVVVHWVGTVIPDLLKWFGRNWVQIFTDVANFTGTIFANMWANIKDFFTNVWSWLSGGETDWKWTDLTKGFESTLEELPKIAKRIPGKIERALGNQFDDLGEKLGSRFQENLATARGWLGLGPAEPGGATDAEEKAGIDMTPDAQTRRKLGAGGKKAKEKQEKDSAGGFEDLGSLYKRIAEAAGGKRDPQERTAKATEKGEETRKRILTAAEKQTAYLKTIAEKKDAYEKGKLEAIWGR